MKAFFLYIALGAVTVGFSANIARTYAAINAPADEVTALVDASIKRMEEARKPSKPVKPVISDLEWAKACIADEAAC